MEPPALRHMSAKQFAAALIGLTTVFLFIEGPLWTKAWDADAVDRAIWSSYLPIPVVVAVFLLVGRKFSLPALFLDTLGLAFAKYAVTLSLSMAMWATTPAPPASFAVRSAPRAPRASADKASPPSVIAETKRATVRGSVEDSNGKPLAGASVFIASGLEGLSFAARTEPVEWTNTGSAIVPAFTVVQSGEPLTARSIDGRMHTLVAMTPGAPFPEFNAPLLSSGAPSATVLTSTAASVHLRCTVHGSEETEADVAVVHHPFFTRTDEQGRFVLAQVPAGRLTIAARIGHSAQAERAIELAPQETTDLRLALSVPSPIR